MQKTMGQILEETITTYTSDTCAVDAWSSCRYLTEDGRMCAVGRCLADPANLDVDGLVSDIPNLNEELKPEYRGHDLEFWDMLQGLHDEASHWDKDGISREGLARAKDIAWKFSIPLDEVPSLQTAQA